MDVRTTYALTDFKIPQSKYIVIDCDIGNDDALCILMAKYLADKYDKIILGITCVEGNTNLENVVTNAVISSKIAGLKVPIAKGAWKTILGKQIGEAGDNYFFSDGLGGNQQFYSSLISQQDRKLIFKQKANQALVAAANMYANNLSILACGPLTNLATAYLLDNELPNKINSISIMGGSYSTVGRHQHFSSDFNFHLDPQAANIVLKNYNNIILTTIQTTQSFTLKQQHNVFQNRSTLKSQFIADIYKPIIQKFTKPILCDPLAAFPLFCPKQAQTQVYHVGGEVMLHGTRTKGMLALDWLSLNKKQHKKFYVVSNMNKQFVENVAVNSLY